MYFCLFIPVSVYKRPQISNKTVKVIKKVIQRFFTFSKLDYALIDSIEIARNTVYTFFVTLSVCRYAIVTPFGLWNVTFYIYARS